MSGPNRPLRGGVPRQPWSPDAAARGVTCPVCGLANEPGARVCRNCGLPIASASDPLRGVAAGRVDIPTARRTGLSATVGLVMVVGLLLVSGTLAVSGGGILSGGGRIGVDAVESASAQPGSGGASAGGAPIQPSESRDPVTLAPVAQLTNRFDYTCDAAAIRDASRSRWNINQFLVGARDGFEQITFELTRRGGRSDGATVTSIDWLDTGRARSQFGIGRVAGDQALVVTFEGPVDLTANQKVDRLFLDPEGVVAVRSVELFQGEDGIVRAVVGVREGSCAKMRSPQWNKAKAEGRRGKIFLDIERP